MSRIALVTDRSRPALTEDDRLLVPALDALGIEVHPAVWDDPGEDWSHYDLVVLRSPWDYHLRMTEFLAWVDRLDRSGARLHNPAPIIRWNARKTYFDEVTDHGVATIPTARLHAGDRVADVMAARGWDQVVVKPEVSAGGYRTFRVGKGEEAAVDEALRSLLVHDVFLVQPFLSQVQTEGEASLVFIDGTYSHAIRKQPAEGDFLTHAEHGATLGPFDPPPDWIGAAGLALQAAGDPLLYARVDLLPGEHGPILVELELIEPDLFLRFDARAASRVAMAARRRLRQ